MLILFPGSAGDLSPFEVVTLNTSPDRLVFLLSEDAGSGRVGGGCEQVLFVRFYNNPAPLNGSMQFHYCTLVTREPEQTTLLF